jgi:hypothetical protein
MFAKIGTNMMHASKWEARGVLLNDFAIAVHAAKRTGNARLPAQVRT